MSKRRRVSPLSTEDYDFQPGASDDESEEYSPRAGRRARKPENGGGSGDKKTRRKASQRPTGADQIRQTFSKRKKGMVLKAAQLSALSKAKVFIFWANDKGHSWAYNTPNFSKSWDAKILGLLRQAAGIKSDRAVTECMEHPDSVPAASEDDEEGPTSSGPAPADRGPRPPRALRRPVRFADTSETGNSGSDSERDDSEDPMDGSETGMLGTDHPATATAAAPGTSSLTQHQCQQPAGPHPQLRMAITGPLAGLAIPSPTPSPTSALSDLNPKPTVTTEQAAGLAAGRARRQNAGNRYQDSIAVLAGRHVHHIKQEEPEDPAMMIRPTAMAASIPQLAGLVPCHATYTSHEPLPLPIQPPQIKSEPQAALPEPPGPAPTTLPQPPLLAGGTPAHQILNFALQPHSSLPTFLLNSGASGGSGALQLLSGGSSGRMLSELFEDMAPGGAAQVGPQQEAGGGAPAEDAGEEYLVVTKAGANLDCGLDGLVFGF